MRACAVILCAALLSACASGPPYDIAIVGATVVTGNDPPMENVAVYLDDETIARIETGPVRRAARHVIDASGKFLIPGLMDSHAHVGHSVGLDPGAMRRQPELLRSYRRQLPRSYLYFGFTTLIDPDLAQETLDWYAAVAPRPALFGCGRGIRLLDGYGMNFVAPDERFDAFPNFVIEAGTDPERAGIAGPHHPQDAVAQVRTDNGICVKTYHERGFGGVFDLPVPSPALLRDIADAAHASGLPLMLHATSDEGYAQALDAGADILAHGLWHWPGALTPDIPAGVRDVLARVAAQGVYVQPTLRVLEGEQAEVAGCPACDDRLPDALPQALIAFLRAGGAEWNREELLALYRQAARARRTEMTDAQAIGVFVERSRRTTVLLAQQSAKLIFGTDTPATRGGGNIPGLNGLREIQAWADAGVPLRELFLALTLRNAQAFGLSERLGTVSAGKRADLLILTMSPLETAAAYDAIDTVILSGRPIARQALSALQTRGEDAAASAHIESAPARARQCAWPRCTTQSASSGSSCDRAASKAATASLAPCPAASVRAEKCCVATMRFSAMPTRLACQATCAWVWPSASSIWKSVSSSFSS